MNKTLFLAAAVVLMLNLQRATGEVQGGESQEWPPASKDTRPWTRWWWLGSAVDRENLTRELTRYHEAGFGGVEITPIYGVHGRESQFIEYLSPRWMEMMQHSVTTATSLGMGVDMATGTGWCFGGPNVKREDANATVICRKFDLEAGESLAEQFDRRQTQALVAYPTGGGPVLEITDLVGPTGKVAWAAPMEGAPWTVYMISQQPSGVVVKRPAPGGAGPMLNLLYGSAMGRYLQRFTDAFEVAGKDVPKPSAMFHDSYEYKSDWAPDFFAQFEKRRGYRLQNELPALFGKESNDHVARVKSDYRETVSDILAEESIPAWSNWAHEHGFVTREQAHGSPGNLLDIYAAADIPETEMFNQDRDVLVSKFASSAAHVTGKNLVGAEAGTWAAEHFCETLSDLKGVVDELFLSGVNRITFHGTAYSPDDAAWPGWCFYASTELNPRNALWHDLPALNAYITRVQSVLQAGRPDNDVLVYWPIHDYWHEAKGMVQPLTVHGREWLHDQPVGEAAEALYKAGVQFDFVSDRQLHNAQAQDGMIICAGNKYKALLLPKCEHMPVETHQRLRELIRAGAQVVSWGKPPTDVPGACRVEERREKLKQASLRIEATSADNGKGRFISIDSLEEALMGSKSSATPLSLPSEPMTRDFGLQVVRRCLQDGAYLFVVNVTDKQIHQWVQLCDRVLQGVEIMDPMTGETGWAKIDNQVEDVRSRVWLELEPKQSIILRTVKKPVDTTAELPRWKYRTAAGPPVEISDVWRVQFAAGGPTLPDPMRISSLMSWTKFGGDEVQSFAGTALYILSFDAPKTVEGGDWMLDLGDVRESARVKLNGENLGTVFTKPFRVLVKKLRPQDNVLEVEVTGTSANRIRDLDLRKIPWKVFYDANVVAKDYKPFDAAGWALRDQGLLGPVMLVPVRVDSCE